MSAIDLDSIPRGNTCHGVNRAIVEHLAAEGRGAPGARILDLPCGEGAFAGALRRVFPGISVHGCDYRLPPDANPEEFTAVDASRPFSLPGKPFDVICCISGVMEFDNTRQFFETCRRHLASGGLFIVTNDNVVTVRDRLAYLFFGKTRRFDLFVAPDRPTWKSVSLQNLIRILHDAGFAPRRIHYVGTQPKDWLMLPLALLLWPLQWLRIASARTDIPRAQRFEMFPLMALIARHYLIVCEPRPASPAAAHPGNPQP